MGLVRCEWELINQRDQIPKGTGKGPACEWELIDGWNHLRVDLMDLVGEPFLVWCPKAILLESVQIFFLGGWVILRVDVVNVFVSYGSLRNHP